MLQRAVWYIKYEISSYAKTLILTQSIGWGSVALVILAK
jgi:hypothetical protein